MAALYRDQLGAFIAKRRKELGLTQRELADLAHVTESQTVSRWERGERAPTDLDAVATALGTTAAEVLQQLTPLDQKGPTQLDRIEQKLDEMLAAIRPAAAADQAGLDDAPQLLRGLAQRLQDQIPRSTETGKDEAAGSSG